MREGSDKQALHARKEAKKNHIIWIEWYSKSLTVTFMSDRSLSLVLWPLLIRSNEVDVVNLVILKDWNRVGTKRMCDVEFG